MSFSRYPAYKDSGVEWLGEVPKHWAVTRLGRDLPVAPRNGVSPDIAQNGSRPSFSTAAVNEGRVDISEHLKLVELDDDAARPFLVAKGDLLLLRGSGSKDRVGSAGLVIEEPPAGCVYPDILIRLHMGATWLPAYGVLLMNSAAVRPQLEIAAQTAAGIWKVSGGVLRDLVVPRPPLPEQRAVAAFLDRETARIDALVGEQERLIELLKEKRQAVISHAVTKGLDPNAAMKDSGVPWLGTVPAHWTVAGLGLRYRVELGKMLDSKQITGDHLAPYLRNSDVQWGYIRTTDLPEMDYDAIDRVRFGLIPGDLLVCEGGEVGRCAVWEGQIGECYYQKALHRVRPLQPAIDTSAFLYWLLHAAAASGIFEAGESKATIAHLPADAFRKYRFPFPPLAEQRAITAYLDRETARVDALIAEAQRAISLLQERRTALITAAVTDQIDVRGLA